MYLYTIINMMYGYIFTQSSDTNHRSVENWSKHSWEKL